MPLGAIAAVGSVILAPLARERGNLRSCFGAGRGCLSKTDHRMGSEECHQRQKHDAQPNHNVEAESDRSNLHGDNHNSP